MGNYEYIYKNAIKNFIITICSDYIEKGYFPEEVKTVRENDIISVVYRDFTIFEVTGSEVTSTEIILRMLRQLIYL